MLNLTCEFIDLFQIDSYDSSHQLTSEIREITGFPDSFTGQSEIEEPLYENNSQFHTENNFYENPNHQPETVSEILSEEPEHEVPFTPNESSIDEEEDDGSPPPPLPPPRERSPSPTAPKSRSSSSSSSNSSTSSSSRSTTKSVSSSSNSKTSLKSEEGSPKTEQNSCQPTEADEKLEEINKDVKKVE